MENLMELYEMIPIGRNNSITKDRLSIKWGMDERAVRKTIQEMRITDLGDAYIIISSASGRGYYRSDNPEEIQKFKAETLNRGKHTFMPLRKVNRILKEHEEVTLVNHLQEIRKEKGFTSSDVILYMQQYDPAFDKATLSKMENARCGLTNIQADLLAKLYDVTPEELTGLALV